MNNAVGIYCWGLSALVVLSGAAGCRCDSKSKAAATKAPPAAKVAVAQPLLPAGTTLICEDGLNDLIFLSPATVPGPSSAGLTGTIGVAVGQSGSILRTQDGGKTWTRVVPRIPKGPEFTRVVFTSPAHGWALSQTQLLHSADTGLTWKAVDHPAGTFFYFGAIAATPGVLYMLQPPTYGAKVFRLPEAASAWEILPQNTPRNDGAALFFLDENHGWLAGNYGIFMRTADGGQTWEKITFPTRANLAELCFFTPEVGWIRPFRGHEGGVWKTGDGGKTWSCASLDLPAYWPLMDMQFFDAETGVVLIDRSSDGSRIVLTRNGGKTWETLADLPPAVQALSFISPEKGWAIGPAGQLHFYCRAGTARQ